MLTANTPLLLMCSAPSEPLITHTRISGGSSDTDENALAVMPYPCSSPRVVTTVTPVANAPTVARNSWLLNVCSVTLSARLATMHTETLADDLVEVGGRAECLRHDVAERRPVHDQQPGRLGRARRSTARPVEQDGHLAEQLAGSERVDRLARAALFADDLNLPVDHDEELVGRPSLARDHGVRLGVEGLQRGRDRRGRLWRQRGEHAEGALAVEIRAEHARLSGD